MYVTSEVGRLKRVLLHTPQDSLYRITPNNCHDLLFDDVMWPEKAVEEHEAYIQLLESLGVEVLLFNKMLSEVLALKEARDYIIQKIRVDNYLDSVIEKLIGDYLLQLSPNDLAKRLLGGLTYGDVAPTDLGLLSQVHAEDDFILPPLPNQLFTRDTSCWIHEGVCIGSMQHRSRRTEINNMATIYKYHPYFKKEEFEIWYDGSDSDQRIPSIEGGDILVINPECLIIGLSQRTKPQSVEILAKTLFKKQKIKKIIAVEVEKERASMHLDTIMTMVDETSFCVSVPPDNLMRSWIIQPGDEESELRVEAQDDFFASVAHVLGEKSLRWIYPSGDSFEIMREQWTDANNLLAVKPGTVVGYERNVEMNKRLRQEGIEVLTISGTELSRGRGGARCMSCPLERESL
jgi:arginine deiminase